jgi:uncharacterized lipoprotein YmbA
MTRPFRASHARRRCAAIGVASLALVAACSSVPPPRYHTLVPASAPSAHATASTASLAWEVLPVAVPAAVDQPQWVVRTVDGSLAVLEQERWIGPLGEEVRAAVADRLTQDVGAAAVSAEPRKRWRIRIDVSRLDSAPGREARLEASWTLTSGDEAAAALRCHGKFVQTLAESGYLALASGHQQAVAQLADVIGSQLKAVSAGQLPVCPKPAGQT